MHLPDMSENDLQRTIAAVWRRESARIVAAVARIVRDIERAEDLAQDAFVQALRQWPRDGMPDQPGAWLLATARRRAIDALRRDRVLPWQQIGDDHGGIAGDAADPAELAAAEVGDDLLRLMFLCCHPVLPFESRTALTLRLLGGLTTDEIARAYLLPEPTIAQRIVRAKRTLVEQSIGFELPGPAKRRERLDAVLAVLYLIFNEGHVGTTGEHWSRAELCEEALRLGRVLAELMPDEAEVHGLSALMELQASRLPARADADGVPLRLHEQDRSRWDRVLIRRGFEALARAAAAPGPSGRYVAEARIAACHAAAPTAAETDWPRIVLHYCELAQLHPSPVVELNRAVAIGMAFGAAAGLALVDELAAGGTLADYHLLASVRGDLLERLGRHREAHDEFTRAAASTRNGGERELLLQRAAAAALAARNAPPP